MLELLFDAEYEYDVDLERESEDVSESDVVKVVEVDLESETLLEDDRLKLIEYEVEPLVVSECSNVNDDDGDNDREVLLDLLNSPVDVPDSETLSDEDNESVPLRESVTELLAVAVLDRSSVWLSDISLLNVEEREFDKATVVVKDIEFETLVVVVADEDAEVLSVSDRCWDTDHVALRVVLRSLVHDSADRDVDIVLEMVSLDVPLNDCDVESDATSVAVALPVAVTLVDSDDERVADTETLDSSDRVFEKEMVGDRVVDGLIVLVGLSMCDSVSDGSCVIDSDVLSLSESDIESEFERLPLTDIVIDEDAVEEGNKEADNVVVADKGAELDMEIDNERAGEYVLDAEELIDIEVVDEADEVIVMEREADEEAEEDWVAL